jgi:hypothetical protein
MKHIQKSISYQMIIEIIFLIILAKHSILKLFVKVEIAILKEVAKKSNK